MYEELVKRLREYAKEHCPLDRGSGICGCIDAREAADAIEELGMKLHGDEAAIAGMKREIERMVVAGKPRWVSVKERLPEFFVGHGEEGRSFCADCAWYEPERKHCWFRKSGAENCVLWEPKMETPKEEA